MENNAGYIDGFSCVDFTLLDFDVPIANGYPVDKRAADALDHAFEAMQSIDSLYLEMVYAGTVQDQKTMLAFCIVHRRPNYEHYNRDYPPNENLLRIAEKLGAIRPFLREDLVTLHVVVPENDHQSWWPGSWREPLILDLFQLNVRNDGVAKLRNLRGVDKDLTWTANFRKAFRWPPGSYQISRPCPLGGAYGPTVPIQYRLAERSLQAYLEDAALGEMVRHIYILDWFSDEERTKLRGENPDWWHNVFETQFHLAEKEGRISDVEHWTLKLERWPPSRIESKASSFASLRRFISKVSLCK